jgi:flagellar M-ring protein FliF
MASDGEAGAAHNAAQDAEAEEPSIMLRRRFQSSGPDLKTELRELVKENPDAAATILRSWIGDAA